MEDKRWLFVGCLVIFLLLEFYSLFPGDKYQIEQPRFWLDPTIISFQTWIDYAATRLAWCVAFLLMRTYIPWAYSEMNIFLWLSVGYFIDYFVIYNNPFAKIFVRDWAIPISYTTFMLIIAGWVVIKSISSKRWST